MPKPTPPRLGSAPRPATGALKAAKEAAEAKPGAAPAAPPPAQDARAEKKKLKDQDWRQKQYFAQDGLQSPDAVRRTTSLEMPIVTGEPPAAPQPSEPPGWVESVEAEPMEEAAPTEPEQEAPKTERRGGTFVQSSQVNLRNPGALPPPGPMPKGRLFEALDNAQEPGVLFQEEPNDRSPEEQEDPELMEAVEEAIRLLFGVRGIHHIGPGTNDAGETVIVIAVGQGFTEESMRRVPDAVRRFKTLVAIPFDLLPLKRSGP